MHTDVLIIGAGPTGLTVANILAQQGVSFRVLERDAGPITQSRALWVHARTLELWDKLGLLGTALEAGQAFNKVELLVDGKPKGVIPYQGEGLSPHPYALVLEQSKTQRLLLDGLAAHGAAPEWGTELLGFDEQGAGVRTTVRHPDGREEVVEAQYLVGADGASSGVRQGLGLEFSGDTYEQSFFLADVEMDWDLGHDRLYLALTKAFFFAFFPMQGSRQYRLIGSVTPELTERFGTGKSVGAHSQLGAEDVQTLINTHSGVRVTIQDVHWASIYRIHSRMVERYGTERVFLAGDAAHVHSPAGGQGMNIGIGDGFNLAWKLAAVVKGEARPKLLRSYEAERLPVAKTVLSRADKLFELEATTNPALQQLKVLFMPVAASALSNLPPAKQWFFTFLSQIGIHYRDSLAVTHQRPERHGVRAGDRLPYGKLATGENVYDLTRGTEDHLLLFEGARPDPQFSVEQAEARHILESYLTTIQIHPISSTHRALHTRYGATEAAVFLLRPDGHIAYCGPLDRLDDYLKALYKVTTHPSVGFS